MSMTWITEIRRIHRKASRCLLSLVTLFSTASAVAAAESTANGASDPAAQASELAKQLQNPIANLISVPIQNNWDFGIGPEDDAFRYLANVQPVIPFSITADWNLITRTIVPIVFQESPVAGGDDKAGLGDIVQSFFLSPKEPVGGGWIVGAGPVFLYPSATDAALGAEQFGLGPTAVLLKQQSGWTYGALLNHLWSVTDESGRRDVSATFLQPFVSFTTKSSTTLTLNTESTYDWENEQWSVPLNLVVSQLLELGPQPLQLSLGWRYYAEKPDGGPDWGLRFVVTLLFPTL